MSGLRSGDCGKGKLKRKRRKKRRVGRVRNSCESRNPVSRDRINCMPRHNMSGTLIFTFCATLYVLSLYFISYCMSRRGLEMVFQCCVARGPQYFYLHIGSSILFNNLFGTIAGNAKLVRRLFSLLHELQCLEDRCLIKKHTIFILCRRSVRIL